MKYTRVFLIFLLPWYSLAGKTTSIIIPCYRGHAHLLYSLLEAYEEQTVLPDEVVISVSSVKKADMSMVIAIQERLWLFPVTIVLCADKKYAGQNRNSAAARSCGDILIYNDADDLPHPQRVEIIKYFFERYAIDHLMHEYVHLQSPDDGYVMPLLSDVARIAYEEPNCFVVTDFHCGNPATSRRVFTQLKWPSNHQCEDVDYFKKVYELFPRCMNIRAPLITYRQYLSATILKKSVGHMSLDTVERQADPDRVYYAVTVCGKHKKQLME